MFDLPSLMFAFIVIAILLLLSIYIKQQLKLLQRLYLPESIIAGAIALALGTDILDVFGAIAWENISIDKLTVNFSITAAYR